MPPRWTEALRRCPRSPIRGNRSRNATFLDVDHSRLGRTGLQVSKLCLGTMTFGLQCDEPTSISILNRAEEGGIDFIDSSDVYPLGGIRTTVGRTEEILGRWLHGKRDRFVLATKCFGRTGPSAFDAGNSKRHIFDAIDGSLRRLQTDYIDLYQLHGFDSATPIDETLGALDDLVHQGEDPATSDARTFSRTSWSVPSGAARRSGSHDSTRYSLVTTCCSGR